MPSSSVKLKNAIKKLIPPPLWNRLSREKLRCGLYCQFVQNTILKQKVSLPFLVVSVGQACNFKCRDCANFCPIAPPENLRYDLESVEIPLRAIFHHVSAIGELQIQGGEPFLYSDLGALVSFLGEFHDKVKHITIATNGSILPSDELMTTLAQNHVEVRISNYGVRPEASIRLKEKCEQFHVKYRLYEFASGKSTWYYTGGINFRTSENARELERKFQSCSFRRCLTLERGELSHCSRATNSYAIQGFERTAGDYLKVEDSPAFGKALLRYTTLRHAMTACQYCHGTSDDSMIPAAVQMQSRDEMRTPSTPPRGKNYHPLP